MHARAKSKKRGALAEFAKAVCAVCELEKVIGKAQPSQPGALAADHLQIFPVMLNRPKTRDDSAAAPQDAQFEEAQQAQADAAHFATGWWDRLAALCSSVRSLPPFWRSTLAWLMILLFPRLLVAAVARTGKAMVQQLSLEVGDLVVSSAGWFLSSVC